MVLKIMIEGFALGLLLIVFCAVGIRKGAVNMAFLYHKDVQDRSVQAGLITKEKIRRNAILFKGIGIPVYIAFVLVSVYVVNGAGGFLPGFWQTFAILSIMNLIDRFFVDAFWVGHTKAWDIPGTEDLKPYIDRKDKSGKWLLGTVGFAVISAVLAGIMALIL
ncbi:MAG: hypothetical protein K6A39_07545 [Clostridiales bacterium]|nr:hypothetical protein [Clostridiales bacterium]